MCQPFLMQGVSLLHLSFSCLEQCPEHHPQEDKHSQEDPVVTEILKIVIINITQEQLYGDAGNAKGYGVSQKEI